MISFGDDVWLTGNVQLINHDASVQVLKKACNLSWIDKVATIEIGNHVFVGNGTILMPGIKIGNNVVIGAGSVVTKSIPSNSVVAGNPARILCTFDEYAAKCVLKSAEYPWDENTPLNELEEIRIKYFWNNAGKSL